MKKLSCFIYLLFLLLILTSCTGALSYYKQGNYFKAVECADSEKNPGAEDYYAKAMSLVKLGRKQEAGESAMLFLLMSDDSDMRKDIADIFVDLKNTDVLNVLILSPTDGLKSQIALYKSYLNLNQTDKAKAVFQDYLSSSLNILDRITLLVNFPYNIDSVSDYICLTCKTLDNNSIPQFLNLALQFSLRSDFNVYSAASMINMANGIDLNLPDTAKSDLYYLIGNSLSKLNDSENAATYWSAAYKHNPDNENLKKLLK